MEFKKFLDVDAQLKTYFSVTIAESLSMPRGTDILSKGPTASSQPDLPCPPAMCPAAC